MAKATKTYDIIFAGGGAAACIIAGRLAVADPALKILVLEAGPHSRNNHDHEQPARFFSALGRCGETFTPYVPKANPKLDGRVASCITGRCLGGGSNVNFMAYCRAAASDYDDWETVYGNKGWGSKSLIPLLRKAETYQAVSTNDTHGKAGPIKISFAKADHNLANEWLGVTESFDQDRGQIDDLNALYACDGYGVGSYLSASSSTHFETLLAMGKASRQFIDGKTGKRSDTASAYIYPILDTHKNLDVQVRKRIVRVIFDGKRAVGVEYVDDEGDHVRALQSPSVAHASRLVVLCAGAFGSPAILERSGIGSTSVLSKNDVQQIVDLPGVGEHLTDHNGIFPHYLASDYGDTLDDIWWGNEAEVKPFVDQWSQTGQGLLAHNGVDAGIRIRPTVDDLKMIGPSFTKRWNEYFANAPDKPIMLMLIIAGYMGPPFNGPRQKFFNASSITACPMSKGYTHITSGVNPYAVLDYDPCYLHEEADLHVMRWAYKHSRELARRMPAYRGELVASHPEFPEGSEAAAKASNRPVPIDGPKIKYTEADDRAIDEYVKQTVSSTFHSAGTCAMKPREQGGVVDERLNVYGVEGLKVADMSIIPENVTANTYNTAIAIGEKAAVIIAQELGIKGVPESD
ncbi:CAZyme family AA3 [Agaricus bisporus var. burnettii]|uniref:pyranose dehydrogenase (acceptor) n=1 Tax=Agaricus bisporus var. burnettii TaxID=192524 RepID=A0A8H7KFS1_AGABI|nr:CAZyme family AA3 [Agaricus bisporus var. burnettii]